MAGEKYKYTPGIIDSQKTNAQMGKVAQDVQKLQSDQNARLQAFLGNPEAKKHLEKSAKDGLFSRSLYSELEVTQNKVQEAGKALLKAEKTFEECQLRYIANETEIKRLGNVKGRTWPWDTKSTEEIFYERLKAEKEQISKEMGKAIDEYGPPSKQYAKAIGKFQKAHKKVSEFITKFETKGYKEHTPPAADAESQKQQGSEQQPAADVPQQTQQEQKPSMSSEPMSKADHDKKFIQHFCGQDGAPTTIDNATPEQVAAFAVANRGRATPPDAGSNPDKWTFGGDTPDKQIELFRNKDGSFRIGKIGANAQGPLTLPNQNGKGFDVVSFEGGKASVLKGGGGLAPDGHGDGVVVDISNEAGIEASRAQKREAPHFPPVDGVAGTLSAHPVVTTAPPNAVVVPPPPAAGTQQGQASPGHSVGGGAP